MIIGKEEKRINRQIINHKKSCYKSQNNTTTTKIIKRLLLVRFRFDSNGLPSNLSHSFCNLAMVRSAKSALCSVCFFICFIIFFSFIYYYYYLMMIK